MRTLNAAVVAVATATLSVATGAGVAHATGGGVNLGVRGVVYNTVTVGGVTMTGVCEYVVDSTGLTITGQATTAGAVVAMSLRCRVKHATYSTVAQAAMPGPAVAVVSGGNPPVIGTGFCIAMSTVTATAGSVGAPELCV